MKIASLEYMGVGIRGGCLKFFSFILSRFFTVLSILLAGAGVAQACSEGLQIVRKGCSSQASVGGLGASGVKDGTAAVSAVSRHSSQVNKTLSQQCVRAINQCQKICQPKKTAQQCRKAGEGKARSLQAASGADSGQGQAGEKTGDSAKGQGGAPQMPQGEQQQASTEEPQKKPLTQEEKCEMYKRQGRSVAGDKYNQECRRYGQAGAVVDNSGLVPFLASSRSEEEADRGPASIGKMGPVIPDNQYNTLGKDANLVKEEALAKTDSRYAGSRVAYFREMGMANDLEDELTAKIAQGEDLCTVYQQVEILKGSFYPDERKMGDRLEEMLWPAVVKKGFPGDEEGLQIYCTMVL